MTQLNNLDLSLIKVGVDKEHQVNLKEDLTKNKLGSAFEKVVALFWSINKSNHYYNIIKW